MAAESISLAEGPIRAAGTARAAGSAAGPRPAAAEDASRLLALVLALASVGIVMVWSTSALEAERPRPDNPYLGDPTFFLRRQVLWTMLASIGLAIAWATDYRRVLSLWRPALAGVGALLVGVLLTPSVKGAHRWFDLGGIHLQPSELGKLAAILFLAHHCADRERIRTRKGALTGFGVLFGLVGLIAVEPDMGTAALVAGTGTLMLLVAGVRLREALAVGIVALPLFAFYAAARFEHVKTRISVFLNPDADPMGKGYQIRQALIALGSGGPTGLGLGESKQKLFFLPDDHTDFILAILGEEAGLVGTLVVLALFAGLVVTGYRIALQARDRQGFLLAFGITTIVGLQAAMNMAVVTASMPTKGISLPFVSFGGSSLLVAMSGIGLLLSVASRAAHGEPDAGPEAPSASVPLPA